MFAVHSSRQEGNGPDTSAFRFPLIEDEQDLCQLPRSQIETQTKLLSYRTMPNDLKLDQSLTEKGTESKRQRRSSTDEDEDEGSESKESRNLTETFVAVIAQGILSVPSKRMTLSSIYNFIAKTFPHFDKEKGPGWRNSVRHNLSSNDCFVKASRAENGKGHYWMIHPKDLPEFAKGNYRRPRKPRRPRCSHALGCSTDRGVLGLPLTASLFPYTHHKPSAGLDLPKPHPSNEPFSYPFGVAPNRTPLIPASSRYDFYAREADTARFPLNQFHGFSSPPPPYGLFWQDNPSFRNYSSHFQSSTFHPYLYMSPVSQSENAVGLNYA